MGLFGLFNRNKGEVRHTFKDEDRELSLALRREKAEIKRLELERDKIRAEMEKERYRAELEDLKAELYGDDEETPKGDTPETLLMGLLLNAFNKGGTPPSAPISPPLMEAPFPPQKDLTDEEIKEILQRIPKQYLKLAKGLNEEQLKTLIRGKLPGLSETTLTRAIAIFNGGL